MLARYNKLVAVAEEMVTGLNDAGHCVDGLQVQAEANAGIVRVGTFGIVSSSYCPDDNVVHPEYGVSYSNYYYTWVDGQWREDEPWVVSVVSREEEIDDLPF
jgi:hypothetical protein